MGTIAQQVAALLGETATQPWEAVDPDLRQRLTATLRPDRAGRITPPHCIAQPATLEELAELMTCAHREGWRILPCGHGTKVAWGGLVAGVDLVVSTTRLNRVVDHAIGDLTVTVEAGLPFAQLQTQLAQTGQSLGLDPAYPHRATLGGIIATADTGALRQRYGGVRDRVIGITLVRHDGQIAKAGGRVVKNVAGYDLMKLMTGSYGTLGIVGQATLRTYPQPEASQTVLLAGADTTIGDLMAAVRRSPLTPVAMDLLSPSLLAATGTDLADTGTYGLALQFQAIAAGVAEQAQVLTALAGDRGISGNILTAGTDTAFWTQIQTEICPQTEPGLLLKVGISPADALALMAWLTTHLPPGWRGRLHASSGIGQLGMLPFPTARETLEQLRSFCQRHGGYCVLLKAPPAVKQDFDAWGLSVDSRRLMALLQAQFDPQGRLSPGRWG